MVSLFACEEVAGKIRALPVLLARAEVVPGTRVAAVVFATAGVAYEETKDAARELSPWYRQRAVSKSKRME